jgi:two-component system response regulator TctD
MRILLIDDDEGLLATMADFFRNRGHEVRRASEVEEAIAMVRHYRFDVIILDLELNHIEGLDGFGVLKAVRQSSPRTQAIVYSAHFSTEIVEAALRYGRTKFIAKPAPLTDLLASAEELCPIPC